MAHGEGRRVPAAREDLKARYGMARVRCARMVRVPEGCSMTRQELYELVWKMPVIHAARSVGLSDKGLANKCKALSVPMPPRGH